MRMLIGAAMMVLLIAAPAWAGSYTTTPEQDKTLAAMAAEQHTTPQIVLSRLLDGLTKGRAQQAMQRDLSAIARSCRKDATQPACASLQNAAKAVK